MESKPKPTGRGRGKRTRKGSDSEDDYRLRLTEYEKRRRPIPVIEDDTEVTIPQNLLDSEFTCPVCRQILHKTMVTISCMHRFCYTCIKEALFKGNKECPACRRECHSMRNLREDRRFDEMIRMVYPGLSRAEEEDGDGEQEVDDGVSGIIMRRMEDLRRMYEEGMRRQSEVRRKGTKHARKRRSSHYPTSTQLSSSPSPSPSPEPEDNEIPEADSFEQWDESLLLQQPEPEPEYEPEPEPEPEHDGIQLLPDRRQPTWSTELTIVSHPRDTILPLGEVVRLRVTDECTVGHLKLVIREYFAYLSEGYHHLCSDDFILAFARGGKGGLDVDMTVGEVRQQAGMMGVVLLYCFVRGGGVESEQRLAQVENVGMREEREREREVVMVEGITV